MKIIFFLPSGVVEYSIPEEIKAQFNFNAVATSTRINGFFISENLYLRHSQMIGMSFQPDDAPAPIRRDLN